MNAAERKQKLAELGRRLTEAHGRRHEAHEGTKDDKAAWWNGIANSFDDAAGLYQHVFDLCEPDTVLMWAALDARNGCRDEAKAARSDAENARQRAAESTKDSAAVTP